MSTYLLGDRSFTSKDAVKRHAQEIWKRASLDEPLTGDDERFALDLIARHPDAEEKIGCGVEHVWVVEDQWNGRGVRHRRFDIERTDGSRIDFGVTAALCSQEQSTKTRVTRVLREAIEPDIIEFRDGRRQWERCAITGKLVAVRGAHVHHDETPFVELMAAFLQSESLTIDTFPVELHDGQIRGADPELMDRWVTFHRDRSKLAIAAPDANSEVGAKKLDRPELVDELARIEEIAGQIEQHPNVKHRHLMRTVLIEAVNAPVMDMERRASVIQRQHAWLDVHRDHPEFSTREQKFIENVRRFARLAGPMRPEKWRAS